MPDNVESDEEIASKVQSGDVEAFGEIINRYQDKLRRYARHFLSAEHEVEDLVQDVFSKAYINLRSFDSDRRFSPWIYRIAHNTFVNEIRRKSRYGFNFIDADTILPILAAPETSDADAINSELDAELKIHLAALPPKYREVLVLFYFESLSYQEIAAVLKIPQSTVGVRMNRGRTKLREIYDQEINKPTS